MVEKADNDNVRLLTTNLLRLILGLEIAACATASVMTLLPRLGFLPAANMIYWSAIHSLRFLPSLTTLSLLVWVFLANAKARTLSPEALDNSPIWAVGWFLVPVVALVKPWAIMTEIYQSSRRPLDWREGGNAGIVTAWWLIRLLADLIGLTTLATRFGSQDVVTNGIVLFCVITMIHQVLLLIIIARVSRWQMTTRTAAQVF